MTLSNFIVLLATSALLFTSSVMATEFALNKLTNPNPSEAKCIDGSAPAYYFSAGSGSGANKWFIFHEGGGWCITLEDCYNRSLMYAGSSNPYAPTIDLDWAYFSSNRTENPFWNWNKAYLKYCDGASFSGNNNTVTYYNGTALYFRGFKNLQAIRNSLWSQKGLNLATDVVVGGCSAGGLAVYLHLDWWADNLPQKAKVRGFPDSGFFPDFNSEIPHRPGFGRYSDEMRWVFNIQNSTVDKDCLKYNPNSRSDCFFAEHVTPFISTPTFSVQAIYDKYQTDFNLGATDWFTEAIYNQQAAQDFGDHFLELFQDAVLRNPRNGAFLDGCHHHCYGSLISQNIDGVTIKQAFNRWYAPDVYVAQDSFPCVDCCPA